ncbi:DUF302 domain-containing protein [Deinococcus arenicola]|uniref:DUF302 domain-containing protein n=1 Tax=Deinococcus arenicola TaxID=2994950 RepID=A0ABU4DRF9_9DEIO|nr:DUF302 domain-containing protein [Deinococcus sp. ZS9-10]MDV6375012.1 DUF302 domain-containing protein [Deinococcus sp. ZS9-10]
MSRFLTLFSAATLTASLGLASAGGAQPMGNGLVSLPSSYSVGETLDRVASAAQALDFGVAARINHAAAAQKVGLELRPTEVLLVGNPKGGTALMQCAQTAAIDLPVKFLAYQDAAGQVWLTYNDPAYLMSRHNASGCNEAFAKAGGALKTIAMNALK